MPRKLFVIHHSLRNFIVSSVLSSIVIIINTTIDGIVVSQAVSTDAISVVSLVTPVLTIVQLFGSMLFSGAALIVASAYGDQQYRKVNQLVTMSLTAVLIFNGLLALVLSMFSGQIAHLLTNEERLLPLVEDYLPYSLAACVCWLLCDAVGRYVKISGSPRLVTNYVILNARQVVLRHPVRPSRHHASHGLAHLDCHARLFLVFHTSGTLDPAVDNRWLYLRVVAQGWKVALAVSHPYQNPL